MLEIPQSDRLLGTPVLEPEPAYLGEKADPTLLKAISAGEGGIVISFIEDEEGRRQPVVGFVGDVVELVQQHLRPDAPYRLDGGKFVVVQAD